MYKLHLDGNGEEIILDDVLKALRLCDEKFLSLCIMAGCDYLQNVRGICINKAKQIIDTTDDFISFVEKMIEAPCDYGQSYIFASNSYLS